MLTVRTSAQILTNRHRADFRLCPASTGAPLVRAGVSRLSQARRITLNAESRRVWLSARWETHQRSRRQRPQR